MMTRIAIGSGMMRGNDSRRDSPNDLWTPGAVTMPPEKNHQESLEAARSLLAGSAGTVSFSGAGLSAESGIATFRDAQTGLWARFDPMTLASAEGFARDPGLVTEWYRDRRRAIARAAPNPAHRALAAREEIEHITQNIDDLLLRAGADPARIVSLHGTMTRDRCHRHCGYEEEVDMRDPPGVRPCPQCGEKLRPSVVWFGEMLPAEAWEKADWLCRSCEVLLVIGTSAVVYPAAALISVAHDAGAKIIVVNTQPSDASALADVEIIGRAGEIVPKLLQSPPGRGRA